MVRLDKVYETEKNIQLLLEYCSAGNLGKLIRDQTRVTEVAAKTIAAQLLLTIDLMEKFDIVHRDLKPENILIKVALDPQHGVVEFGQGLLKRIVQVPDIKIADLGYAIKLQEHYQ